MQFARIVKFCGTMGSQSVFENKIKGQSLLNNKI